jgi:hypothetical protein
MLQENPAAKLHTLLDSAKKKGNQNFRFTWANVFDIEQNDTSALLEKYNSLLNLYFSTKKIITENERLNNEKNIKYINLIGQALGLINFNNNTSQFISILTPEVMTALYYLSENISFIYDLPDSLISDDQLKEILEEVEELIFNITDSNLPPDVKQILVNNLYNIKESLHSYFITGIDGVRESLERSIGSTVMNNQVIAPEVENENVKGFFNVMLKINEIVSTLNGAKELIAPLTKFFLNK